MHFSETDFKNEFVFKTSRSSGKGGQHLNKVESRVSLFFNVKNSNQLSLNQKQILLHADSIELSKDGSWQIDVEDSRSQLKNKKIAVSRFLEKINKALEPKKDRLKTKPSKASVQKRLSSKRAQSEKKKSRKYRPDQE